MATLDFAAIKQGFDLETTVIKYLGQPTGKKWLCPFHTEDSPSFGLWADGERFKCFGCGAEGDILDFIRLYENLGNIRQAALMLTGNIDGYILDLGLSPIEAKAKRAEIEAERKRIRAEREAAKLAKEQEAINRVSSMQGKVEWYHSQVKAACPYWHSQGINDLLIDRYNLGYAPTCPILYPDEERQGSYVIPYYESGQLVSIRHRLSIPNGHGKYRPEFAGLSPRLFNVDSLTNKDEIPFSLLPDNECIVVEGEIKSVVIADRLGCACVGLPGANNWRPEWASYFKHIKTAYWLPDPGLEKRAIEFVACGLKAAGCRVVIASLPQKPDDLFVKFRVTTDRFLKYLQRGRLYQ